MSSSRSAAGAPGTGAARTGMSINQIVGYAFGAVYLLVGLLGFLVTGFGGFVSHNTDKALLGFELNPLHNVVHLAIGALLAYAASRGTATARSANTLVGAVYLLVGVLGLFIANDTNSANLLSLNGADNGLHLLSALVLLGVGLGADRTARARA